MSKWQRQSTLALLASVMLAGTTVGQAQQANVSYSGGAVRLPLPDGWTVSEMPADRAIRLLLTPGAPPQSLKSLADGVWLNYHYRAGRSLDRAALQTLLASLSKRSTSEAARWQPPAAQVLGGLEGWLQTFTDVAADGTPVTGYHWLAATDLGMVELHWVAPQSAAAERAAQLQHALMFARFGDPALEAAAAGEQQRDAVALLGTWKGLDRRLTLAGDGKVEAVFDGHGVYALDSNGYLNYAKRQTSTAGEFTAKGDVLHVTWNDGRRVNFRWRLQQGQLLLTDHHGRVNELARLFSN